MNKWLQLAIVVVFVGGFASAIVFRPMPKPDGKLNIQHAVKACQRCGGTGMVPDNLMEDGTYRFTTEDPVDVPCQKCKGTGRH